MHSTFSITNTCSFVSRLHYRAQSLDNELSNLVVRLRLDEILELAEDFTGLCETAEILKLRDKVRLFGMMVSQPQPGPSCTSCHLPRILVAPILELRWTDVTQLKETTELVQDDLIRLRRDTQEAYGCYAEEEMSKMNDTFLDGSSWIERSESSINKLKLSRRKWRKKTTRLVIRRPFNFRALPCKRLLQVTQIKLCLVKSKNTITFWLIMEDILDSGMIEITPIF